MKKYILLVLVSLIALSCGGGKKTISSSEVAESKEIKVEKSVVEISADTIPNPLVITEINIPEITEEPVEVNTPEVIKTTPTVETFNHSVWNSLLKAHVSNDGNVRYQEFRQVRGQLREYIASLGAQMPADTWSKEDKLAYWMNAYNAMTVDLILRNLPLESIKDIDKPWNQRLWKLGDKWYNLDEIEHQILRKMGDARIHFGINCASFSCPPLLNEAFTANKVEAQLDRLANTFINDERRNQISEEQLVISKIFDWFSRDFKQDGNLIDFLNKYAKVRISNKAKKRFMEYDWTLNQ